MLKTITKSAISRFSESENATTTTRLITRPPMIVKPAARNPASGTRFGMKDFTSVRPKGIVPKTGSMMPTAACQFNRS